jgi:TolB protein
MKPFAFPICLCLSLIALAAGQQRKIAFERGRDVWVANLDGTGARKIAEGTCPDISPDGTRLAFNTGGYLQVERGRPPRLPERRIAVADLARGKLTIFRDIPSDNCFRPVWSPDGSKLAFHIWAEERWRLGIVNVDGSGFYLLKDESVKDDPLYELGTFWEPAWARDADSIFCHDMGNIYHIDLQGNILKKWVLSELQDEGNLSSDSRLSVSADGRTLLIGLDLKHGGKSWVGAQRAVYRFDLGTTTITRVSGQAESIWNACWLTNDEFLCSKLKEYKEQLSICRMSINGENSTLVTKNARMPSVSAP